ncbi:MAG: hypothetical protein K8W52_08545 [Deltaproteobacteria bacterium]|nr:hypothetical protein [Deltaproteobacteria bacterium]
MTTFADLSPCDCVMDSPDVLAVGWLGADEPYSRGEVAEEVFAQLMALLVEPWAPFKAMGRHACELCRFSGGPGSVSHRAVNVVVGGNNLFIPSRGVLYVAPSSIVHYIDSHGYAPPAAFCAAVLACPPRAGEVVQRASAREREALVIAPSWTNLLPRGREARDDLEAVTRRVLAHVQAAARDSHGSRAAALRLPAEEMARILILHGPRDVQAVAHACNESLLRAAIDEVERGAGPAAISGLMAFANARTSAGEEVPGLHDQQTRRLCGYERTWLDDLARQAAQLDPATRRLAITIAIAIEEDRSIPRFGAPAASIARVAGRPDDPQGYMDLIAAFPDVELTWTELLFVARAFCARIKRAGAGHGGPARWLHALVRDERIPPLPQPPPAIVARGPDATLVRRAAELFSDDIIQARVRAPTWVAIELGHLHGLWGGHDLTIRSDGGVIAKARAAGGTVTSHVGRMTNAGLAELDVLLTEPEGFLGVRPSRPGIPDETAASITLVTTKGRQQAFNWDTDHHEGFDRVRDWLDVTARALIATRPAQPLADVVAIGQTLDEDVALLWARYLAETNRAALAFEVAADVVRRARSDDAAEAAIALLEQSAAFPVLESLCREVAALPGRSRSARVLGAALGRLRWLPALAPLLGAPFDRACATMHGAIAGMMGCAEPGDAVGLRGVLLPAARGIVPGTDDATIRRRAERFRRAVLSDLAGALARCGDLGCASELADEIRSELDGLDAVDGACARAGLAVVLVAAGDAARARALVDEARRTLEDYFDDDLDDHGVPWFDVVAYAHATVEHLATWTHGMPWAPIEPVSRLFAGPVTVRVFPPQRAVQERWRNEIDFRTSAAALKTPFSNGQLALAMDVVDRAFSEQPEYGPWLLGHLAGQLTEMDDDLAGRLGARLGALTRGGGAHDSAIEAGARALARSGRAALALPLARRLESHLRTRATLETAVAWASKRETRELGLAAAEECLRIPGPSLQGWMALARVLLADEVPPVSRMVVRMAGEFASTFTMPDQVTHMVLAFGNGLEGDARITCSDAEAVQLARRIAIGSGGCRRIAPPTDTALYRPGDECYRQHGTARLFLSPIPTG